ncbi:MAG: DUF5996 family protein [Actinomycetota bacterium]|nr:DUF5996 family protein [Actinomycetota bacterium]
MLMPQLPDEWDETRGTLQAYSQALTALPRAAGDPNDRWTHVAMRVAPNGLVTAPTRLADGEDLIGIIDLAVHEVILQVGDDVDRIDMTEGPSASTIGEAALTIAARHGSTIEVDRERFAGSDAREYEPGHARAFLSAATFVSGAFSEMNASVPGEVTGPHLWPHGFDIATEWFSPMRVPFGESEASAQIAVGWYPQGDGYFYANPWPFQDAWGETPVLDGTDWHLDGWQGAVLDSAGVTRSEIVAFGLAVHDLARERLETSG